MNLQQLANDNQKFKTAFEGWFAENVMHEAKLTVRWFYLLTPSMQIGVLIDFFESVGIEVLPYRRGDSYAFEVSLHNNEGSSCIKYKDTKQEARTAAITKAIQIFEARP
ncbi:MAG: hypothetical protein ACI9N9_000029 [Enterobacterales bacterium]|jgi:hypothetical protein